MLNCREVTRQADQYIEGGLTRRQRFAMRLHLMMCRHCQRYIRQMRALLRAIPGMHREASDEEVENIMTRLRTGGPGPGDGDA